MKRKLFAMINLLLIIQLLSTPFNVSAEVSDINLSLSFTNLASPGEDHYEGWLIVDGSPVSTGKFTTDGTGKLMDLDGNEITSFSVSSIDVMKASKFVLTLEEKGDSDSSPNSIKPLAGDISDNKATLSQNIGKDFSGSTGYYILATPTNGADTDENSGIWFLSLESGSPAKGLNLPDLSGTDWTYEGWVVINDIPVTTGTFDNVSDFDNFDGYSSTQDGPPFPGEDFLVNAPSGLTFPTDISGMKAVISVEPRMDNDAAPFMFKPLVGDIPADAVDHMTYSMSDMSANFATGSMTFEINSTSSGLPGATFLITIVSLISLIFVAKKFRR